MLGTKLSLPTWCFVAAVLSGLIFPLGLALSKPLRANPMAKSPLSPAIAGAFIAMLLFWPMAFAAAAIAPAVVPLILAIGMSLHWPVIGWAYGKLRLFAAHAVVRAVVCTAIWFLLPDGRTTVLPAAVALIYFATTLAIAVDRRRLSPALTV
ncbi:MAG: hypothetical protein JWM77_3028 [Rhodospirillales bacterium]|nr:hypothetical protein [Rhodospirillales bacterium]